MFENRKYLYIKVLIIILLIIICFFSNRFFNKKINYYKNLIIAKQKELKVEKEYKKRYFDLEKKYDFEIYRKEKIVENLNLIIDKNNIDILNMKTNEREEKILIELKILSSFANINDFLYYISQQKSFCNLKYIQIQNTEKANKELLVKIEIEFRMFAFIENNNNNTFPKMNTNNLKNPFQLKNNDSNYVLNANKKEIVMKLPIRLIGIIIGEKNKLAIIELNNEVKSIRKGYKNSGIEVVDIKIDNINVKYEKLLFKINLGGNKGVLQ